MYRSPVTHRVLVIAPRLTLPTKQAQTHLQTGAKIPVKCSRVTWKWPAVAASELGLFIVMADIGNIAYWYLAAWPIYRIVAFVVLVIIWANMAAAIPRAGKKSKPIQPTKRVRAPIRDTTMFLVALKRQALRTTGALP